MTIRTGRRSPTNGQLPDGLVPNGQVPKAARRASLFDIVPGKHRPNRVRTGAFFTLFVLVFLWVLYTKPSIPLLSGGGTTVKADLAYAANVRPGYTPVRVLGVDVGQVTDVQRSPSGRGVRLTINIDSGKGVSMHEDATLSLRWRTLLGRNMYVDLTPGSRSAPALGDHVIPKGQTTSQVELDQAVEPLNAQGRAALQTMIDQFDAGFSDPAAVSGTIRAFAPAMRNLAVGLPGLRGTQQGDLANMVRYTSRAMGALARDEVALGGVIDNGSVALGVTAARRIDLGSIFDQAPAALQQTRITMARLRTTLDVLDPIAERLRPGARELNRAATLARTALAAAAPLLADVRPTLAAMRPSVTALATAASAGVPVLQNFTPVLDRVRTAFIPFLNKRDAETKLLNYQAVGPAVAGVASAVAWGDRYSTLADFEGGSGEGVISGSPCQTFLADPTVPLQKKIDCTALTQILANIFTGKPLTTALPQPLVSQNLVTALLKGGAKR
jgi:ABC-type transporter Mla subunit MlaD